MATERVKHIYSHARYGSHKYDHRTDCDWTIEAPIGKNVHLTFLSFQVEYEEDCGYDFVEVYSGLDSSGPSYGKLCGNSVRLSEFYLHEATLLDYFKYSDIKTSFKKK